MGMFEISPMIIPTVNQPIHINRLESNELKSNLRFLQCIGTTITYLLVMAQFSLTHWDREKKRRTAAPARNMTRNSTRNS